MNNLIITLISIALTALAAVMAIFYGGTVYNSYLAQVKANEIINDMRQLQTAITYWQMDNGGGNSYPQNYIWASPQNGWQPTPTPGAACPNTTSGITNCWYNNLTYQNKYLDIPLGAASWWPPVSVGVYGTLQSGVDYFSQTFVAQVVWDTTGAHQYILTQLKNNIYTNPNISQTQLAVFLIQLCQDINKDLGLQMPYTGLNVDTNTLTGTNTVFNLPYDTTGVWSNAPQPIDGSTLMNTCFLSGPASNPGAGYNQTFMVYFKIF